MKKKMLIIVCILFCFCFLIASCESSRYREIGIDEKGYTIIYKTLSTKEIAELEHGESSAMYLYQSEPEIINNSDLIAEVEITSLETGNYKKEGSLGSGIYFTVITANIVSVYGDNKKQSIDKRITIFSADNVIYKNHEAIDLMEGNKYIIFLSKHSSDWMKEIAEYGIPNETTHILPITDDKVVVNSQFTSIFNECANTYYDQEKLKSFGTISRELFLLKLNEVIDGGVYNE